MSDRVYAVWSVVTVSQHVDIVTVRFPPHFVVIMVYKQPQPRAHCVGIHVYSVSCCQHVDIMRCQVSSPFCVGIYVYSVS